MKFLTYSSYNLKEGFDMNQEIEKIEKNVRDINNSINTYQQTNADIRKNEKTISESIEKVNENKFANKDFSDIKENKRLSQWLTDSTSMIAQDKFVMALGGIALASLIILNTQL
jgi:septal ring factor EnvC (AmiA/AmiB activator)